jgi:hypothetical protein
LLPAWTEAAGAAKVFWDRHSRSFDSTRVARAYARMCALPEDKEHWLEGFRKAGLIP